MPPLDIIVTKKPPREEVLRIDRNKGHATAKLKTIKFRDRDTRQMVIYIPSLEITGYGSTEKKAHDMVSFCANEYFEYLFQLTNSRMEKELLKLGWLQKKLKHKEFSKAFVDIEGNLQGFNAVADKIEVEMTALSI